MGKTANFLAALALCVFVSGCVAERMREDHLELIQGKYVLTSFLWDNEVIPTSSLSPSDVLSAEIYQSDNRWFFDFSLPEMDFEGNVEYRRGIIPLDWNTALGIYQFDFSNGSIPKTVTEAYIKDGAVTISACDPIEELVDGHFQERNIHFYFVWKKASR